MTAHGDPTRGVSSGNDGDGARSRTNRFTRRTFLQTATGAGIAGLGLAGSAGTAAAIPTPRLHTDGRWIRAPNGDDVVLRGMAPADPGFYRRFHPKSFEEVLEWATDPDRGWHPNTVRLPLTQDSVDALGLETYVTEVIRPAVDLLRARDVYALVDFHLIRPYTQAATETYNEENDETLAPIDDVMRTFWSRVAPEFADDEHVIYELFNEPTQPAMYGDDAGAFQTWRDAAQPWVDLVREEAPETPIVIGSPRWTSVTHMAPEYPFEGENLIYAAHIYPDNGAPSEFDQWYGEPAADVPVVVTEFGWDPAGGSVDQGTTSGWGQPFREWVEGYDNVGWVSWCFDDSWEPTFFDSPDSGANEPWTLKDDADQMGGYVKSWLADTRTDGIPESTIDDSTAPPAPENLTIDRTTEISVEVSWDAVTDEGEAGLSNYVLYVDGTQRAFVVAGTTQATVDGLDPSSTYEIGVSAVDEADNESNQATVVAETIATDAGQSPFVEHAIPGRIQAEDFDSGGQGVSYNDTSAANEAGADYRDTAVDVGTAAESGYNVGYLAAGEWLEYTVEIETGGTYLVVLNAASGADSGGDVRLEIDRSEIATQNVWPTGGWDSWEEIRVGTVDLPAGEHVLRLVVESAGWNLDWIEFEAQDGGGGTDATSPSAPSNLSVSGTSASSIDVAWDAASDSGGSGLDHYDVSLDGSLDQQVPAGTTSATVADLSADTSYEVGVSAVDGAGNESGTSTVAATTDAGGSDGDTTPPTTPSNLTATATSTSSVELSWDASADSDSGLDHYVVSVDGSQDRTVAAAATGAVVDGLAPDTSYEIGVSAVDGAGNESDAATVSVVTTPDGEGGNGGDGNGDALIVNDYDGDPAWSGRNDLGNWNGAGSFQNGGGSGEVVDGALELAYENAGWFVEQVDRDVSAYDDLVFEISGASGGEGDHFTVQVGGVQGTFADLADGSIGTSTAAISIDLEAAGVDQSAPGELRLNFWEGGNGSSQIAIEEIRFE